jgi:hypothetical protein
MTGEEGCVIEPVSCVLHALDVAGSSPGGEEDGRHRSWNRTAGSGSEAARGKRPDTTEVHDGRTVRADH